MPRPGLGITLGVRCQVQGREAYQAWPYLPSYRCAPRTSPAFQHFNAIEQEHSAFLPEMSHLSKYSSLYDGL